MVEIAPGSRVQIRDEEWLVRTADPCDVGGRQLACIGISETVRNREAIFLTEIDEVKVLDPRNTELVTDDSPRFISSLLYLEARLRQTIPTGTEIAIGHRGAMDPLPFQLQPTARVLEQLRPRFLIADAVGLGKTLEAGILVSELMRRGRGRRILVVTTKSMMQQFQKEFWTRFSIPLTRLDSAGIQRIRRLIPASHNPFHYYDKTIISVDTLKRDLEYRHYLEQARWDVIIIDEAHNVSFKGNRTLNNRLATLLAQRSDALIMLTATPHSGDRESFASLMRMLDPTVLPRKADYAKTDVEHLFLRRFKRDVRDEIPQDFPERRVFRFRSAPSRAEEQAFARLAELKLAIDDNRGAGADMLFRTTLEKSLFSSPAACAQSIKERISRLRAKDEAHPDLAALADLKSAVEAIGADDFSKLGELVQRLKSDPDWKWDPSKPNDRVVIFTERIETLKFLQHELPRRLELDSKKAVAILHGQLADAELADTVESFGRSTSPLRLLIASDVASEGLNLHFQSHRLIHFDIPWSLMVFQQRNGRVDRYGQVETPLIAYLSTDTRHDKIRGDLRILEILIEKDEQAAKNIGDPSIFMGLYDEEKEIKRVATAIESNESPTAFENSLQPKEEGLDWLDELMTPGASAPAVPAPTGQPLSFFKDDYDYVRQAFEWLNQTHPFPRAPRANDAQATINVWADDDLDRFLERELDDEMWTDDRVFALCANPNSIEAAIGRARDTSGWPELQFLWPLHPIMLWLDYKLISTIGRQRAPVVRVRRGLEPDEACVLVSALIPNRRGQPVLNEWFAVRVTRGGQIKGSLALEELMKLTGLGREEIPNAGKQASTAELSKLLAPALDFAAEKMVVAQRAFSQTMQARSKTELDRLEQLSAQHKNQLELEFAEAGDGIADIQRSKKQQLSHDLDTLFSDRRRWIADTLEIDSRAHLTVAAVFIV
jgi:superfamily II DNA or RNA helicase